jgi:hypothetical protein
MASSTVQDPAATFLMPWLEGLHHQLLHILYDTHLAPWFGGSMGQGIKGKLAPRYIGPFENTEACGPVAYRIHLPSQLATIHDVFHISQLKKCIKVPTEVLESQTIEIEPDLSYVEQPLQILHTKERVTRRKKLKMYRILWDHHTIDEATWETEDYLRKNFPDFLKIP